MASDASIARNFGSPRVRAVAATASAVILLSSGPTAMNASRLGSRASSSSWPVPIAATARKVSLAGTQQTESFGRPGGRDRRQPHGPALVGKGLGHRLDHLVIVASRRSDGNPERYRPQRVIQCTRSGSENEKS